MQITLPTPTPARSTEIARSTEASVRQDDVAASPSEEGRRVLNP